jgi:predicted transcriptional regulator
MPTSLQKELERLARERGWTVSDVITTALDEYVQWAQVRDKKSS